MDQSAFALAQAMVAIGVDHEIERLAEFNQPIHQPFDDLDVGIRFTRPRDDQELALQAVGVVDRGGTLVAVGIHIPRPHEDLLKPGVVEVRLWLGHHSNSNVIRLRLPK